uniref:Uncharacterized protein n=1 Tax=Anopheles culicifacies TaxID=139723 RepID=A0A182LVX8_9DIPT
MRLILLTTVCLTLSRQAVHATVYTNAFLDHSNSNPQQVELYRPFSLCGLLEYLSTVNNSVTKEHLDKAQCTIGCVNKTSDAFRIGIYACDGGLASFALPISFTDMDFSVQYSDTQFIAEGQVLGQRLYLQLVPNLSCLAGGRNNVCVRVTKYEKRFVASGSLEEQQTMGSVDIGINVSVWQKASMNIAEFEPFVVCGKVSKLTTSNNILNIDRIPSDRLGCTVGCVNRTKYAVEIEIYSCNNEDEMVLYTITLNELKFFTCFTDEYITMRAKNIERFIEFRLEPDVGCLRQKRATDLMRLVLPSHATLCVPESDNSTFLSQYKPFEFCSKVAHISSPLIEYMDISIPPLSSSCLISCVKRTRHAVLIEIVNCSSDEEFIPALFITRMNFVMCASDGEIILHGYDTAYWIEFTFSPEVDCLRSHIQTACTRIVNYSMKYAYRQIINGFKAGTLNINLDKHIWRVLARNRACHMGSSSMVGLRCWLPWIIVYVFCTHFVRYERMLL